MMHLREEEVPVLKDEDSKRLMREMPNLPKSPDQCITCKGKKTFKWYMYAAKEHYDEDISIENLDRGYMDIVDFECPCENQWVLNRYLHHCGIGINYQRLMWIDLAVGLPKAVREYKNNAESYLDNGLGITLVGTMGTGKSMIANLLLKDFIAIGYDGYFTTFAGLLEKFRSGFTSQEEKAWFFRRIRNAKILIIDDIGKEQQQAIFRGKDATNAARDDREINSDASIIHTATAFAEAQLDEIVRYRVSQALPTLMTTNYSLDLLSQKYGDNIVSLMTETNEVVEFQGKDFRDLAKEKRKLEARAGLTRPIVL